jgi:hypothetical protein
MNPFEGNLSFNHIEDSVPQPQSVLASFEWSVEPYNAPFLAGIASEPGHGLVELTAEQAFGNAPRATLPKASSKTNKLKVVGDISHELKAGTDFIMAQTTDFKQAGELAAKMGYRPAFAGEFLQLLWWLRYSGPECIGWFYCYADRRPGYATLAEYNAHRKPTSLQITFDTHIGNQLEEGYVDANMDTHCFFVRS